MQELEIIHHGQIDGISIFFDMHEKYMKVYERYKSVYNAVRPLV